MRVTNCRKFKSMKSIIIICRTKSRSFFLRRNSRKPLPQFRYMLKFDRVVRLFSIFVKTLTFQLQLQNNCQHRIDGFIVFMVFTLKKNLHNGIVRGLRKCSVY